MKTLFMFIGVMICLVLILAVNIAVEFILECLNCKGNFTGVFPAAEKKLLTIFTDLAMPLEGNGI